MKKKTKLEKLFNELNHYMENWAPKVFGHVVSEDWKKKFKPKFQRILEEQSVVPEESEQLPAVKEKKPKPDKRSVISVKKKVKYGGPDSVEEAEEEMKTLRKFLKENG